MNKISRILTLLIIVSFFSCSLNAQFVPLRYKCSTDEQYAAQVKAHPEMLKNREEAEKLMSTLNSKRNKARDTAVRIIPVVVHVIHNYGPENISDQDITDQIATLNQTFRRQNSDTSLIQKVFKPLAEDLRYKFALATIDPNGKCTNGIVRVQSNKTYEATNATKAVSYWDNSKYLNIWIVNSIDRNIAGQGYVTLGYAQFPYDAKTSAKTDGIILVYFQMKKGARSLTHEIGHWMGLYHTFQGGCSGGFDDQVDDTPPTKEANFRCTKDLKSCGSGIENVENFMDYSDCPYMFTKKQKVRVDGQMDIYRNKMFSASNLKATGVSGATGTGCIPVADFFYYNYDVCQGSKLTARDNTFNATPTDYAWDFSGGTPSTSTDKVPLIQYNTPGKYDVSLKVSNGNGSNTKTKSGIVNVVSSQGQVSAPYPQGFESFNGFNSENFRVYEDVTTGQNGWEINSNVGYDGGKSIYVNNTNNTYTGVKYTFMLPTVDMTKTITPTLNFKVAYAQKNINSTDILKVSSSRDCGQTWQSLYYKTGADLATMSSYRSGTFTPSSTTEWRSDKANLASYRKITNCFIKFEFTSNAGNNLYIDDIDLGQGVIGIEEQTTNLPQVTVFPNPNQGKDFGLNIDAIESSKFNLNIFDMQGKEVFVAKNQTMIQGNQNIHFQPDLGTGVYVVSITMMDGSTVRRKLVVE